MQEVVLIFKTRFLVSRKGEYVDRMFVQDVRACVRVCVFGSGGVRGRRQAIARVVCHYTVFQCVMNERMTYSNQCSNTSF